MSSGRTTRSLHSLLGRLYAPELDCLVSASRRQHFAVRADCHGQHALGMVLEDGDVLAGADVPEHDVRPARGEGFAIWAERHGRYKLLSCLDVDGLREVLAVPHNEELD